jgi:pimeloyl-ACP methyl ester carboxylesterase
MTLAIAPLTVVLVTLVVLAAASAILTAWINRHHPPEGELVAVPGGKIHVAERSPAGREPAADVVLIHGASSTLGDQLVALSGELASRYRVLAVDRPGQGWSEALRDRLNASPSCQARHIAKALRRLGVEEAVIVGHSLGAAIAAALAIEEPSLVRGLVFLAPASHPWPGGVAWHYRLAALPLLGHAFSFLLAPILGSLVFRRSVEASFRPQEPPADYAARAGARRAITPPRFRSNGRDLARLKQHVTELCRRYHEIETPTVIITGDMDDTVWPSIHSHGLARDIPGAKLVLLEGVGHMPHHARPDAVLAAVDEIVAMRSKAQATLPVGAG